ncbi:cryptochrome/photolyase family protein [Corynebacterium cystitidis]|uniref:Deoxyribodipyrimidine photo-lyase type I n=1 Tax=Corynebacterium cystitidis DSM 20524 TaxID=1121357 RepID=A0A1H9RSS2_9CORY|nr:deoxyribodipyrimidine photo-lyase [Corynebacterium cystitidis]WJY82062.1 Deoxyribodipyrimidine photo-lyase [Corynebacterium cystitidis DSM 20524]SER75697.1 deoxyribodipyrimidine photo-lyase type I [Corynebacterium cystitidis DSM 20524]SNV79996.1 deoxyribodipyrimidine photo-lyase [Corynebacterium cystitidis]
MTTLVWFRDDLRTHDHEALTAACADGPVVAVWVREEPALHDGTIDSPTTLARLGPRPLGAATRWWYHRSLDILQNNLRELGIRLLFARGDAREIIPALTRELQVDTVRWSRRYAWSSRMLDAEIKTALKNQGIAAQSHRGALLVEPFDIAPASSTYYQVFTPFYRAASQMGVDQPLPAPRTRHDDVPLSATTVTCTFEELELLDTDPAWWENTVAKHWSPGERSARERLDDMEVWLPDYRTTRDDPNDANSTSQLSPYLRAGNISPREVLRVADELADVGEVPSDDASAFVRQLYWREFSWHLLYHQPHMETQPLKEQFRTFPYQPDAHVLDAWQRGRTGIALVDAGMMQLWHTGWMHNRVRMVVASLLSKNLLQPWWDGEAWFWDTLVDADEANNPVSWQWVAGCGADASPYFRIFNPELQQKKFDPDGRYVTRWLAEQDGLPVAPIVDLKESRREALAAYEQTKSS